DCMIGDQTLFQRADMVEAGWGGVDPFLDVWKGLPPPRFPNYSAGTWGPKEAEEKLEQDERGWRGKEQESLSGRSAPLAHALLHLKRRATTCNEWSRRST